MNGAVYISFFQGQLESVLEQVVQLAVQELSKTVGSSLNGLLLETAVKEQENRRLRLQVQARESDQSKARDERQEGGQQQTHAAGAGSSERGLHRDTRRLEQRGRVVEQLKGVMQRVLDFAVGELTKIVEASFDDLLLEITKMEREQQSLEERLGLGASGGSTRAHPPRRRGSENDSVSPSGSEDNRDEGGEKDPHNHAEARSSELSSAQDWVPILNKVFGQKWCGDWSVDRMEGGGPVSGENRGSGLNLDPRPSSPQQDPRWTPLEDMEVLSPDENQDPLSITTATTAPIALATTTTTTVSAPSLTAAPPAGSSQHTSASMLHRLLTLPSQLLEEDGHDDNNDIEALVVSMTTGDAAVTVETRRATNRDEDEEDEEEEEEDKRKKKRRRVWTECENCGRRFSRVSLLKAHRQSHIESSPPLSNDTPSDQAPSLSCSDCGKRFSSNTRLQSHVRTNHGEKQA